MFGIPIFYILALSITIFMVLCFLVSSIKRGGDPEHVLALIMFVVFTYLVGSNAQDYMLRNKIENNFITTKEFIINQKDDLSGFTDKIMASSVDNNNYSLWDITKDAIGSNPIKIHYMRSLPNYKNSYEIQFSGVKNDKTLYVVGQSDFIYLLLSVQNINNKSVKPDIAKIIADGQHK